MTEAQDEGPRSLVRGTPTYFRAPGLPGAGHSELPPINPVFPLLRHDAAEYLPTARMADRAVPVDFGRFLALIPLPLDPDVTSGLERESARDGRGGGVNTS